jgi:hypothetical protein
MTKTFPSPYLFGNDTRRSGPLPTASPVSARRTPPDAPGYDNYKYGVTELNAYANRTGANDIRLHYPSRKVTYIIGEKVPNDDHFPDTSCAATHQRLDGTSSNSLWCRASATIPAVFSARIAG